MRKRKFKRKVEQEQYDRLLQKSYPITFEKDKIGGSWANAFNAGYKGLSGGIYRYKIGEAGRIFYVAGIDKRKLDDEIKAKKNKLGGISI